jgi:hypothetical protein
MHDVGQPGVFVLKVREVIHVRGNRYTGRGEAGLRRNRTWQGVRAQHEGLQYRGE